MNHRISLFISYYTDTVGDGEYHEPSVEILCNLEISYLDETENYPGRMAALGFRQTSLSLVERL